MRFPRTIRASVAAASVALLAIGAAACSSDGAAGGDGTAGRSSSTIVATEPSGSSLAPTTDATGALPTVPTSAPSETTTPATAAPSPTGVPGISAPDTLCANWARYSGTLQIIAVAANFADLDSVQLAALELAAAPTIDDAVSAIGAVWPAELEAERVTTLDGYLGPYERRAAIRALAALRAAGLDDDDLAAAREAWALVLATHDPDQPTVDVVLTPDVQTGLDAAATAFDAAVTPFVDDPSLQVRLDTVPATKAYLAANCPELASIGVGDDV